MKLLTNFFKWFLKNKAMENNNAQVASQERILIYSLCNFKYYQLKQSSSDSWDVHIYWGPSSLLCIQGINNTRCSSVFLKKNKWRGKNTFGPLHFIYPLRGISHLDVGRIIATNEFEHKIHYLVACFVSTEYFPARSFLSRYFIY